MASGRSTGWLVALALAALMPSDATAAEPVVRDSHVEDVLALGGTFVYRRSGVPLRRSWMRVTEGRVQRAHGVPARGRASAIGRDRDGRVVVTMAVEGSGWWLYDVVADRSRRLQDLPQGRCAPTAVAVWRARTAYAVECGSPARGGVFLRTPERRQRVAPGRWSAGWSVSLTLRGDELAASRQFDEYVEIHRLVEDGRACRTLIDSLSMEDWTTFGPWLGRGKLTWALQELYPPIGQPTSGAVVGVELAGQCRKPGPIGGFLPASPITWARGRALDGRSLYSVERDGVHRQRLPGSLDLGPPLNDDFGHATPLDGDPPLSVAAPIGRATGEPGEPYLEPPMGTVWYAFRPATTQAVRISSPTALIFTGSELGSLSRVGDMDPAAFGWIVDAVAGETYWIQLRCGLRSACFVPTRLDVQSNAAPTIGSGDG
jgi:hypothetical protein